MKLSGTRTPGLREVLYDTETTGFDNRVERVVEIACVEVVDLMPTGTSWHTYLNPDKDVPDAAFRVHGLDRAFLSDKPRFADRAQEFLGWIGDSQLVAHNASFDIGFINAELKRIGLPPLRNPYVDTVSLAKQRFPGAKAGLDDLCRRFGVDLSKRVRHGALIDTQLLARVYLELRGGRHRSLDLSASTSGQEAAPRREPRPPRSIGAPSAADIRRHAEFLHSLKNPMWTSVDQSPTQRGP